MFPPYTFTDQNPTVPLTEITPLSRRAWAALARLQEGRAARAGQMRTIGAIDMLDGLEYHHTAFMNIIGRLAGTPFTSEESELCRKQLVHEVIAYLNRMGQFYYFAHSSFAKQFVPRPDTILPTHVRYKPFRDKHTAHRAIDAPRKEDTPEAQHTYAWALSSMGGMGFSPKAGRSPLGSRSPFDPHFMWRENYFQLQLIGRSPGTALNFSLEKEHPFISMEAYELIEKVLVAV